MYLRPDEIKWLCAFTYFVLGTTQKIIAQPHAVSTSKFHLVHLILNVKKKLI